jgi:hypothetical protein
MKQETKAQLELAKAMNRLAEGLERFQDPDWWQRAAGQAFQTMVNIPAMEPILSRALPPPRGSTWNPLLFAFLMKNGKK